MRHRLINGWFAAGLVVIATQSGCISNLLEFDAGDRVDASTLEGPESAELLVRSAVGDFECAFGQYIVTTGQVTDELDNANLASTEAFQLDRRAVNKERTHYALFPCATTEGLLTPVQTARYGAEQILTKLEAWTDQEVSGRGTLIARAAAFAGYSLVLLGEGFCSAAIDLGPELTSAQVLERAEERFTQAIDAATAASAADLKNLALVGRARTRLDLNKKPEALADAELVSAGFEYLARMSGASLRSRNPVYNWNVLNAAIAVGPNYLGLEFNGVPDPRVDVYDSGTNGQDNLTPLLIQRKYASVDAPIRIASYVEAQLIIAEIVGGSRAVDIINALHTAAGLPSFSSSNPATIAAQVLDERRRELFLESQHFFDVKRLSLPLIPAPGTSYGPKGGVYGDMRCFPLPDVERDNNPNL